MIGTTITCHRPKECRCARKSHPMQPKKIGRGLCQRTPVCLLTSVYLCVQVRVCMCTCARARTSCDRKRPRLAAHHRTVSWNRLHQSILLVGEKCAAQRAEFCRILLASATFATILADCLSVNYQNDSKQRKKEGTKKEKDKFFPSA